MLNKDLYTAEQLQENYKILVEKWGEWEIIGENSAGLVVRYVDIGKALFSGLMITYSALAIFCLSIALIFGKLVFPLLAKAYINANDEMVDMATLTTATKIDKLESNRKVKNEVIF